MGWRLYLALAVLLLLGADVRPQPLPSGSGAKLTTFATVTAKECQLGRHGAIAVGGPEAVLQRNREAAADFGSRRQASDVEIIAHVLCVEALRALFDQYRRSGLVSVVSLMTLLEAIGLEQVQISEEPTRLRYGGFSGVACVAGIFGMAGATVAVISPLPNRRCLR